MFDNRIRLKNQKNRENKRDDDKSALDNNKLCKETTKRMWNDWSNTQSWYQRLNCNRKKMESENTDGIR